MELHRLEQSHLLEFRDLRLAALREHPYTYLQTFEEERKLTNYHAFLLSSNVVVGAFDAGELIGFTILSPFTQEKVSHKAQVWGAYVKPAYRGMGLGKQMRLRLFEIARRMGLKYCVSSIVADNAAALAIHKAVGYEETYREKQGLRRDDGGYDDIQHLVKYL